MSKKKVQIRIAKTEWQTIEHAHEAMIDREIFDAAQNILLSKSHSRAPRRAYHPLTGILFCGKCSQGMVCQKRSYKDKAYRYYICKTYHKFGRKVCNQANIPADDIEEAVLGALRRQLEKIPNERIIMTVNLDKDMERLQQGIRVNLTKKEKWKKDQIDIFAQRELFDGGTYQEQMLAIKQQIELLDDEIARMEKQRESLIAQTADSPSIEPYMAEFKKLELDVLERKRVLLHEVIQRISLTDQHLEIEYRYDFEK